MAKSVDINKLIAKTIINNVLSHQNIELFKALNNPNRQEIISLLKTHKEMSISDIQRKTKLAYKNVHAHIKMLASCGIVRLKKREKVQGRKVLVSLTAKV